MLLASLIKNSSKFKKVIKYTIGCLLVIVVFKIFGEFKNFRQLVSLDWLHVFPVVLFWTFLINILAVWRWHILLKSCSNKSNFLANLNFFMAGNVAGQSTSKIVGELGGKLAYLKSQGIDTKRGILTIFFDKLLEGILFLIVLLLFVAEMFLHAHTDYKPLYIPIAILLFIMVSWFLPKILSIMVKFLPNQYMKSETQGIISDSNKCMIILLTIGKYLASAMRYMFILDISGVNLSFVNVFMGASLAQLGLIVGITPGGLGFVEAGWGGALNYFGISSFAITKFLVAQRLLIFTSVFTLSFILLSYKWLSRKFY